MTKVNPDLKKALFAGIGEADPLATPTPPLVSDLFKKKSRASVKKAVTVYLNTDLYEKVLKINKESNISVAGIIEKCVESIVGGR